MSFRGFNTNISNASPQTQIIGFSGFQVFVNGLTRVMVQDTWGKGIAGVRLSAENTTSGIPFITETSANGNAQMQLDANTEVLAEFQGIQQTVTFDNSAQVVIDLTSKLKFA